MLIMDPLAPEAEHQMLPLLCLVPCLVLPLPLFCSGFEEEEGKREDKEMQGVGGWWARVEGGREVGEVDAPRQSAILDNRSASQMPWSCLPITMNPYC